MKCALSGVYAAAGVEHASQAREVYVILPSLLMTVSVPQNTYMLGQNIDQTEKSNSATPTDYQKQLRFFQIRNIWLREFLQAIRFCEDSHPLLPVTSLR